MCPLTGTIYSDAKEGSKRGGLRAYVRESIVCNLLNFKKYTDSKIEIMWLMCIDSAVSYFIACCYFPSKPDYNSKDFVNTLCLHLDDYHIDLCVCHV